MKILSTRTFASDESGLPVVLPRTPTPRQEFAEHEDMPAARDVGADWLDATGVVDAYQAAQIVPVAVAPERARVSVSDAWLDATGAGFAQ